MKAQRFNSLAIHTYEPGDVLFGTERSSGTLPVLVTPLGGSVSLPSAPATKVLDIIKPKSDDYPALSRTLQVLKFEPDDVVRYHEILGSVVNLASGLIWGVGAVFTVANVVQKLLGPKEDENTLRLRHLSAKVDAIYNYLAEEDAKGLHTQAVAWRSTLDTVRNAVSRARISRSPSNLDALVREQERLDRDLHTMLDINAGNIAFQRSTYSYTPGSHWIDACAPPYMSRADGENLHYRDPDMNLQARIWDPGHYVDVLLNALSDRLLLLATTEPAYRSTYYDIEQMKTLVKGLTTFITKWRASMILADPVAGLNGGGPLGHPIVSSPPGIAIGAIDPVTGTAFFDAYWHDFTMVEVWKGSILAKGKPDETRAKDPKQALSRALDLQPRLVAGAIRASGIHRFIELRERLQAISDWPHEGSDFVDLPNATFHPRSMAGPASEIEFVELGFVGQFSKNPNKQYRARRYMQVFEKRFRFDMAMRTDRSFVQLGYRMDIGGTSLELIPFSVYSGSGSGVRFPTQSISKRVQHTDGVVYDVLQSTIFTPGDEDVFEGGSPRSVGSLSDAAYELAVRERTATPSWAHLIEWQGTAPERVFTNEHRGPIAFDVEVNFSADLDSPDQPFAGSATVRIVNADPGHFRGGFILPITIYETRVVSEDGHRKEFVADRMTIHFVPSFLVVDHGYFADRRDGMAAIDRIFSDIDDRYIRYEQQLLPIEPEWSVRRRVLEDALKITAIERFQQAEPSVADSIMSRFRMPNITR